MTVTDQATAEAYEPPTLTHVGDLGTLTKGTASAKNSDDNDGSSYYDSKFVEAR
jgi:hypothetical protein